MKNSFKVTINKQIIYTHKAKPAPARLRRFLDEMDDDMQCGINLGQEWVEKPTDFQKQQYVSMKLFNALEINDNNKVEVMSSYLISRNSQINEIQIMIETDLISLTLK